MAYSPQLSEFVYKCCHDAVAKYHAGEEDPAKLMELADWLCEFRAAGKVTDAQLSALSEELGVDVEVPDAPDAFDAQLAALQEDVAVVGDAIAELAEIVAGEPAEEEEPA